MDAKLAVEAVAGEGGFGTVYRGTHLGLEVPVAIKCFNLPARLSLAEQRRFLAKFRTEARLLYRLSRQTAKIVHALDFGAATAPSGQWTPYIVMEWLEGMTLEHDLQTRRKAGEAPQGLDAAIRTLTPAAEALGIVHRENVSHRDVKPANLFLCSPGGSTGMKVLDFGIAKVFAETPSLTAALAQTTVGRSAFTPTYGAPEQFSLSYGATGPWTDVFAMTLVLLEVASGRRVLQGRTLVDLFMASLDACCRPELFEGVTGPHTKVAFVLRRALTHNPEVRFQNMTAFWSALVEARRGSAEPRLDTARSEPYDLGTADTVTITAADRAAGAPASTPTAAVSFKAASIPPRVRSVPPPPPAARTGDPDTREPSRYLPVAIAAPRGALRRGVPLLLGALSVGLVVIAIARDDHSPSAPRPPGETGGAGPLAVKRGGCFPSPMRDDRSPDPDGVIESGCARPESTSKPVVEFGRFIKD